MMKKAADRGVALLLPVDVVCADAFANDANLATVSVDEIPDDLMGLDIGPETAELYAEAIGMAQAPSSGTAPWASSRCASFEAGTRAVAEAVAANAAADHHHRRRRLRVAAVNQFGLADKMTHISTGGGASLELLEGEALARRRGPSLERKQYAPARTSLPATGR